jgi:2-dehydropantoate 2-reductase
LWNQRWEKLCANTMATGLSGLTGLDLCEVYAREDTRRIAIALAAEALALGQAKGFDVPALFGVPAPRWRVAATVGSGEAREAAMSALAAQASTMVAGGKSGTLQDLLKKRPTEVEFLNGYIAREAPLHGVAAPMHAFIADAIREVECDRRAIGLHNLEAIAAFANHAVHADRPTETRP